MIIIEIIVASVAVFIVILTIILMIKRHKDGKCIIDCGSDCSNCNKIKKLNEDIKNINEENKK